MFPPKALDQLTNDCEYSECSAKDFPLQMQ